MRKKNYKGRCEKQSLEKFTTICKTYDPIQTAYANILVKNKDISEVRCNVILDGECSEYPFDDPVAIVCNEDGKLNHMELNRALYTEDGEMFDIVAGPMFVCGLGEEDFASLQGELLEKYLEKYKQPETFIKIGSDILAMKIPERQQQQEKQTHKNNLHH